MVVVLMVLALSAHPLCAISKKGLLIFFGTIAKLYDFLTIDELVIIVSVPIAVAAAVAVAAAEDDDDDNNVDEEDEEEEEADDINKDGRRQGLLWR
mmetsp:Transcript_27281/g.30621  ORF Transcript_27281/g.30621 Transcript_27281/m.30621 type:complete len:96 (-) Transcript_27281:199-486(-)